MGAMDSVSTKMAAMYRANILSYASDLLSPQELGDSALVTQTAVPLLEWADAADGSHDLYARMRALSRADMNDQAQLSATRNDPQRTRLTAEEFLNQARAYYGVIAGNAA